MEILVKENEELRNMLLRGMRLKNDTDKKDIPGISNLLKQLILCAETNANRKPNGWDYSNTKLKEFGCLFYLITGLQGYVILSSNLPFPSISTVKRELYNNSEFIKEGQFRFESLKHFLDRHGLPKKLVISEDGTKITGRIQYDPKTNQVVGFVLPLDNNGLPVVDSYPASSAQRMAGYFSTSATSNYAYVIVVQPLGPKAPSFILCMYGTNNRFKASQVLKRWTWMQCEAAKYGLEIIAFSSDGDSRLVKTMIHRTISSSPSTEWIFFKSKKKQDNPICVQDHIHIGTKLKNRLDKPSIILPIGNSSLASRGHLVALIENVSKDQHDLSLSDINCKDKMNFRSVQKICDPKVVAALHAYVPQSEGTATYLQMIRDVLRSFMDTSLLPLERVEMLWKWVFFLREWRSWILKQDGYTLQHNFITSNTYTCIEINAHSMVNLIVKLRDSEEHNLFQPWHVSSQPCEGSFRSLRATGRAHCGIVSYSQLDLIHRTKRIEYVTNNLKLLEEHFVFPRHHKAMKDFSASCYVPASLPEDYEINQAIMSALQSAMKLCVKFKLIPKVVPSYVPKCQLNFVSENDMQDDADIVNEDLACTEDCDCELCLASEDGDDSDLETDQCHEEEDAMEDEYLISTGTLGVKSFDDINVTETSPYVKVTDNDGNNKVMKKSTFLYLHQNGKTINSSDRNVRYQAPDVDHRTSVARKPFQPGLQSPSREDNVCLADWCAFVNEDGSLVVGRVHAFSYMQGKTWKNQEYSLLQAPVNAPSKNARGIGVLCSWFKIGKDRVLKPMNMDVQGYYSIDNYICTLPKPMYVNGTCKLTCTVRDILKNRK